MNKVDSKGGGKRFLRRTGPSISFALSCSNSCLAKMRFYRRLLNCKPSLNKSTSPHSSALLWNAIDKGLRISNICQYNSSLYTHSPYKTQKSLLQTRRIETLEKKDLTGGFSLFFLSLGPLTDFLPVVYLFSLSQPKPPHFDWHEGQIVCVFHDLFSLGFKNLHVQHMWIYCMC